MRCMMRLAFCTSGPNWSARNTETGQQRRPGGTYSTAGTPFRLLDIMSLIGINLMPGSQGLISVYRTRTTTTPPLLPSTPRSIALTIDPNSRRTHPPFRASRHDLWPTGKPVGLRFGDTARQGMGVIASTRPLSGFAQTIRHSDGNSPPGGT